MKRPRRSRNDPASVLFIERTVNGELARRLRTADEVLEEYVGDKVKIVERAGTQLKNLLCNPDPWKWIRM